MTDATRVFIREHQHDDPARLLLSAKRYPAVNVPLAVAQIRALEKVRAKIPSWYRFDLTFPPLLSVEQASSEQTARFKAGLVSGKRMADLTGGMGVDAYFFAQHFEQVTYVERNADLAEPARFNFGVLGASNIEVLTAETEDFLKHTSDRFDLLYIDPARRDEQQRRVFRLEDCQPNVPAILDLLLARSAHILLKTAPLLDLKSVTEQLGAVARIWVVAVDNEVKEVLYLLSAGDHAADGIPVTAVNLGAGAASDVANLANSGFGNLDIGYSEFHIRHFSKDNRRGISNTEHRISNVEVPQPRTEQPDPETGFTFTRAEEQTATPEYAAPQRYLYEPNAAILKAGAFKSFATRFGLAKLHPHTHLYTSADFVPGVPGRSFEVESVVRYDRKAMQAAVPDGKANIAVRNFPDSAEAARKKLGLKDGGEVYLFGVRDMDERVTIIVCKKQ